MIKVEKRVAIVQCLSGEVVLRKREANVGGILFIYFWRESEEEEEKAVVCGRVGKEEFVAWLWKGRRKVESLQLEGYLSSRFAK